MDEGYIQRDIPVDVSKVNVDEPTIYPIPVGNGDRKLQSITINRAYSCTTHTIYAFCRNVPSLNTKRNVTDRMEDLHDYVKPYIDGPFLKSFITFGVRDTDRSQPYTINFSGDALQLDQFDVVRNGLVDFRRYFEAMQSPSFRGIRNKTDEAYMEKVKEKLGDITPKEYTTLMNADSAVDLVESRFEGEPTIVVPGEYSNYLKLVKVLFTPEAFDAAETKQTKIRIRKEDHLNALALLESYRASMGYIQNLELVLYHNSPIRKYMSQSNPMMQHKVSPLTTSRTYAASYGNPHKTIGFHYNLTYN